MPRNLWSKSGRTHYSLGRSPQKLKALVAADKDRPVATAPLAGSSARDSQRLERIRELQAEHVKAAAEKQARESTSFVTPPRRRIRND